MFRFNVPIPLRIAAIFGLMVSTVLWTGYGMRMIPSVEQTESERRASIGRLASLGSAGLIQHRKYKELYKHLHTLAESNPSIVSVGLRGEKDKLFINIQEHDVNWDLTPEQEPDSDHYISEITGRGGFPMQLEIRFTPLRQYGMFNQLVSFPGPFILACSTFTVLLSWIFLRNVLKELNPSKVVPMRVRSALDALSEGLFLIDKSGRIVLTNKAFVDIVRPEKELIGTWPEELNWRSSDGKSTLTDFPWKDCLKSGGSSQGSVVGYLDEEGKIRQFMVNSVPIDGEDGKVRGALVSIDDITAMEAKKAQMARMLEELRESQKLIKQKNRDLEFIATRDPLTGCLNRRSFFETFEVDKKAARYQQFSCAMVDIDHFKSINDNHGHATGDAVLKEVGNILREKSPVGEKVCRFGGEEFCVFLPGVDIEQATEVAEKIREVIAETPIGELRITASLGVSTFDFDSGEEVNAEELLEQSDQALYFSKQNGRNQVTHFEKMPDDFDPDEGNRISDSRITLETLSIPFESVSGLMRALSYRDQRTAAHSCRVANLCVKTALSIMNPREVYILEAAALLHDIGKIGVPDHILLKPGKLTDQEWQIMDEHDSYSVEIVSAAYGSEEVLDIVASHHAKFGKEDKGLPIGENIPLGARILSVCDAYDAMVSDRIYRKGCSREEAIAELRRCAPMQFDPKIVELFIEATECYDPSEMDDTISTQCAMDVGMHIEKLSEAVTRTDLPGIKQITKHLIEKTEEEPVPNVTTAAKGLQGLIENEEKDLEIIYDQTVELLTACRLARSSLVNFNYCRMIDQPKAILDSFKDK